jgi:phage N-6-adenine-methyltransferase
MNAPVAIRDNFPPLARYEAACRALAEAKSIDEVRDIRDQAAALRAYAQQAKNKQLEQDAIEIRWRAERRIGEIIAAQKETVGLASGGEHGGRKKIDGSRTDPSIQRPTLAEAGIDKHLADRARKLAAIPAAEFEERIDDWRARIDVENERVTANLLASGANHVRGTFGTGENEWFTPVEYIELARRALGEIDLDPASNDLAQKDVCASDYFTVEDNGLSRQWYGRVWLNPPYAQPAIENFVFKLVDEVAAGRVEQAILLTHNYTDTAWFQKAASAAAAICFTRGRVRFVSPQGDLAAPTQGQAFFYFGDNIEAFADAFRGVGFIAEVRA